MIKKKNFFYLCQQLFTKEPSSIPRLVFCYLLVLFLCSCEHTLHNQFFFCRLHCSIVIFLFFFFSLVLCIFFFCVQFSQAGSVVYAWVHVSDECRTLNIICICSAVRQSWRCHNCQFCRRVSWRYGDKSTVSLTAEIKISFLARLLFGARASCQGSFRGCFPCKHRRTTSLCRHTTRRDPPRRLLLSSALGLSEMVQAHPYDTGDCIS